MEASLCTPSCKIKINVHPWIIVYIKGSWTLGKAYGIKPRCYWEHLGNLSGTLGGTNWEQGEGKTKNPFQPSPKRKKTSPSWGHAKASHWLHEISLSTIVFLSPFCWINFFSIFRLFLSKFVCFGFFFSLTRRGHGKPPTLNPQSLLLHAR